LKFTNKTYKVHKQRIILPNYDELNKTIKIYNKVIQYLIPIVGKYSNSNSFLSLKNQEKMMFIEKLIHKTERNSPKYKDFNKKFLNLPSYMRRAAINDMIGMINSFNTRFEEWEKDKEVFESKNLKKKYHINFPKFNIFPEQFPTYYKNNMFKIALTNKTLKEEIFIKVNKNTKDSNEEKISPLYDFVKIGINDKSSKNFLEKIKEYKVFNPEIVKKGKKFFLYFTYEKKIVYKEKKELFSKNKDKIKVNKVKILGIDLGINSDATCSIIDEKGTVLGRKFINFPKEKGSIQKLVKKKNKSYSKTNTKLGNKFSKVNKKISNLQKDFQNKIVNKLMKYILKNNINYVVFENLDNFLKVKNRKVKEKFHYWNKIAIQNKLIEKLQSEGIRYRKINPFGTSKYAFDGSETWN